MKLSLRSLLIGGGILCLTLALGLGLYNLVDSRRADHQSATVLEQLVPTIDKKEPPEEKDPPDHLLYPDMEMPTIEVDGQRYVGYLEIPDLDLRLPVAAGEFRLKTLLSSPAVYSGSVYRRDMVIAAHNYRSHFGRLNQLDVGAPVRFIDADGNVFDYTVAWEETVFPSDRQQMVTGDAWHLTLFTCTYNGEKRFTLRCVLADQEK